MNAVLLTYYGLAPLEKISAASPVVANAALKMASLRKVSELCPWLRERSPTPDDLLTPAWEKVSTVIPDLGGLDATRALLLEESDTLSVWKQSESRGIAVARAAWVEWRRENPHAALV